MDLNQVFFDFFGKRIADHGLYGPVEYIAYSAIMLVLMFFVIFPVLDRHGVRFDARFFLALLPYILLGSALRVLEDMALLSRSWNPLELPYYFITPGIYVLIAVVTIVCLAVSLALSKKLNQEFTSVFALIGILLSVPIALFELMNFQAWVGVVAVLLLTIAIVAILVFAFKKLSLVLFENRLNVLALASQVLDGSATFVATQFFFCGEQHPLSGFLLDLFPVSFILAKVALVLVIIHYVDKEVKNPNLRGFIKIVVAILGFATGLRDLLTLGVGTCL